MKRKAQELFRRSWDARNKYIQVILDRSERNRENDFSLSRRMHER